ncbi:MAG: hypothetical protein GY794_08270 [bacterium]|nr:hypothetical protein [bacterium]
MTEQQKKDETLLIDYLLGRCDEATRQQVDLRLEQEADFRALRDNLTNTFDALKLLAPPESSGDLVDRTLAKIASARQSTAEIARQELIRTGPSTFSLRELATVAAVAIIMAVLFIPWAREARERASQGKCAANVGQIGTAMKNYALANRDSLPLAHSTNAAWLPGEGRKPVSNSAGLFHLVSGHYAPPGVFQCVSDTDAAGEVIGVKYDRNDFPASRYISYSYQHSLGSRSPSRTAGIPTSKVGKMAILSDKTPVFENGRFQAGVLSRIRVSSRNHAHKGQNVLYLNWGVKWQEDAKVGVDGDNIFLAQDKEEYDGTETPANATDSFLLPAWSGSTEAKKK